MHNHRRDPASLPSIFDPTFGIVAQGGDTLDLDTAVDVCPAIEDGDILAVGDAEDGDTGVFHRPPMPTHYTDLPEGMVHAGHFNTDGWLS